jgi:hypothetical protein
VLTRWTTSSPCTLDRRLHCGTGQKQFNTYVSFTKKSGFFSPRGVLTLLKESDWRPSCLNIPEHPWVWSCINATALAPKTTDRLPVADRPTLSQVLLREVQVWVCCRAQSSSKEKTFQSETSLVWQLPRKVERASTMLGPQDREWFVFGRDLVE